MSTYEDGLRDGAKPLRDALEVVGLPVDAGVDALIAHHRANAKLSEAFDALTREITLDRALDKAVSWLDLAATYEMATEDFADRGMMISACADVADTWVRIAQLRRSNDGSEAK